MRGLMTFGVFVLAAVPCSSVAFAQDKDKPFPANEEINLVVTQADRAMQQYKLTVTQEESVMGQLAAEAVAQDKQLVEAWEVASKGFKARPQAFNSELGLELVLLLDDASRNAALCSGSAGMDASKSAMERKVDQAESILQLGRACTDVSTLLYTVSESTSALYKKFVQAEQDLAVQSVATMQQCAAILKKSKGTQ